MATSICIHDVRSVTTSGVSSHNANAITLRIEADGANFDVTLFDLADGEAEFLDNVLHRHAARKRAGAAVAESVSA